MRYGKILTTTLIVAGLTGCAATQPSAPSETARVSNVPPQVNAVSPSLVKASASPDVKMSYSTGTSSESGNGVMTGTSVSYNSSTTTDNTPRILTTTETTNTVTTTQPAANVAPPVVAAQPKPPIHSFAGGFSAAIPYQKAWQQTAKILPSAGYPVMEKDELTGTYYVLDKAGTGGKIERDTPIYQVRLTKSGEDNTRVMLLNATGQPVSSEASNRILGMLKSRLI